MICLNLVPKKLLIECYCNKIMVHNLESSDLFPCTTRELKAQKSNKSNILLKLSSQKICNPHFFNITESCKELYNSRTCFLNVHF